MRFRYLSGLAVTSLLAMAGWAQVASSGAKQQLNAPADFNVALMKATFLITDPGGRSAGTVFLMGRPFKTPRPNGESRIVLVTAAHVLNDINEDLAIVLFRREKPDKTGWDTLPTPLAIRANGRPLWTQHPTADVAVMYINVPEGTLTEGVPPVSSLATDEVLEAKGIHPGDEVGTLGYPVGASGPYGFPIFRSGRIASYPLTPTKQVPTFLIDFPVFPGNSGGPVYVLYGGSRGQTFLIGQEFITVGLVSQETLIANRVSLGLATVVQASKIAETIEMLPLPD